MDAKQADALVFFGATDDLAKKKIIPALQEMMRHGYLNVPVIGVARAGWDVELVVSRHPENHVPAYTRLLENALAGDPTLFAREDGVEAAWRVVDPVLGDATPLFFYEPSTWGPPEADDLIQDGGSWHNLQEAMPQPFPESCGRALCEPQGSVPGDETREAQRIDLTTQVRAASLYR